MNYILKILNISSGITTVVTGLVPELIAIKNALSKSGSDFQTDIASLEGDIMKTTGDTVADIEAWKQANPQQ